MRVVRMQALPPQTLARLLIGGLVRTEVADFLFMAELWLFR